MLALIFFDFETAFQLTDLSAFFNFCFFLFLNLSYQWYVVSDEFLSILFKLINFILESDN